MTCEQCGQKFNPARLDEVMFHAGDHKPIIATGIEGKQVEQPDAEERVQLERLNSAHRTTMTQKQRKELIRILLAVSEGEEKLFTIEQLANMNDRQIGLTWLRLCDYITEGQYQREFEACEGPALFPEKPKT